MYRVLYDQTLVEDRACGGVDGPCCAETSKQQKMFDKMKIERERCCAGRDAVERICKEYLDNELMEKDQLKQAEVEREAVKESKKKADKARNPLVSYICWYSSSLL